MTLLQQHKEVFRKAGCDVLVITCGTLQNAQVWLQDVECTLDILVDSERKIYHWFGLGRSVSRVWNSQTIQYYAEVFLSGRMPVAPYRNDDVLQLAGDFIVDNRGHVILSHPSQTPTDRPSVDSLLTVAKTVSSKL